MPIEMHQLVDRTISKLEVEGGDAVQLIQALHTRLLLVLEMHRQVYIRIAEIQMVSV
jgi:hypothetical protein